MSNKTLLAGLLALALVLATGSLLAVSSQTTLWKKGDAGVAVYRIPALCTAPDGKTLVAVCDARVNGGGDLNCKQPIHFVCRRSTDNGKTWTPSESTWDWTWNDSEKWAISDPSLLVDEKTKTIFLFGNVWENAKDAGRYQFWMQSSKDNGKTWSKPVDLTDAIRPPSWPERGFEFITSGSGIQTKDGTLLHTIVYVRNSVALFGSTDHGKTWKAIGNPTPEAGDECKVVELANGDWMINSRRQGGQREIFLSKDKGQTWTHTSDTNLLDPACNAQIMRVGNPAKKVLVFSNCKARGRSNLYLRTSFNDGATWNEGVSIEKGGAAYSDVALLKDRKIGVLFEGAGYGDIRFCTVTPKEYLKK